MQLLPDIEKLPLLILGCAYHRKISVNPKLAGKIIGLTKLEALIKLNDLDPRHFKRQGYETHLTFQQCISICSTYRESFNMTQYWSRAINEYEPTNQNDAIYKKGVEAMLLGHILISTCGMGEIEPEIEPNVADAYFHSQYQRFKECREDLQNKRERHGFVYVIDYGGGVVKIGKSIHPEKRMKSLTTMSSLKIVRSFISEKSANFSGIEKAAHRQFNEYNLHGEMFTMSYEKAVDWVKKAVNQSK